ncbi:LysR family transcriptional regulator [Paracoccus shanxieyensis]|uniref:LysR family transcriptional regulator n=1 Tax=Paracoccus shanxieyensis TaxID=2675752 RepID=A0A6L6IXP6_9RHOB|nr:LysR family transcriptional regulator [Paracoccus shanxieyensis]MTH65295.1 LysR family transcriptional regulator [Paracoccus shanxieyensis]MTH88401.1 LysR family transcriptional regulator [Paracoccus shanxieyensis]
MAAERDQGEELLSRGIKLRQLSLLVAVQRSGQLSRAAAITNMTQPAASRMLADLERIVGAALTLRHSRGVSLTPAGERLAERARAMLRDLDVAGREVRDIDQGRVGSVHLGSVSGPSLDLVLPIVRSLERAQPRLRVKIDVGSSDRLSAELLSGQLDLYLGRVPDRLDPTPFELSPIGPEPLSLIVRKDHPLAQGCDLADCLRFDWVMQPAGSMLFTAVKTYLERYDLPMPQTVIETASLMLTAGFVLNSQAVGVMSTPAARLFAGDSVRILPVAEDLRVGFYSVVTLRDRKPTSAAQTFLKLLRDELRQRRAEP